MRHICSCFLAILMTISICSTALAYPTFTDPKTGYEFYRVDSFCGPTGYEFKPVSDFIHNYGLHMATRQELEVLFDNIGPYTKTMALTMTGYAVADVLDDMNGIFHLGGWYDEGGLFGIAMNSVSFWEGGETSSPWHIGDPVQNAIMDPDIGLWVVSKHGTLHAPEPSTLILLGTGLAGICLLRKRIQRKIL